MIRVVLTVYILKFNSIEIYYMCKWQFWTCDLVRFASQSIISVKDVTKSGGLNLLTFPKGIISQFPFDVSKRLDICMFLRCYCLICLRHTTYIVSDSDIRLLSTYIPIEYNFT